MSYFSEQKQSVFSSLIESVFFPKKHRLRQKHNEMIKSGNHQMLSRQCIHTTDEIVMLNRKIGQARSVLEQFDPLDNNPGADQRYMSKKMERLVAKRDSLMQMYKEQKEQLIESFASF